jgi:pimeloyl-ACP methyl ester carboxylesterase
MRYAIEHRERVLGQIVTNSISGFSPPSAEEDAAREARARAIEEGGRTALEAIPFHPRHAKRLPRDAQRELVRDAALLSPLGIAQGLRLTRPDLSVAGELGRIRVPTLLVNGLWEKRFQPMRDVAAAGIPGVRVVDLEGGHSINLEAAGAFDEAVCGFIRFLPAAPERIRAHG